MDRKKANAIFKGSLIAMTVLLWEGSGICRNPYPVWAADESSQYGQYGTFDMGNSEAAGKIGTDIGDASPSLGEKFSGLEKGKGLNGLNGFSGNISSVTDGTNTQSSQATPNKGEQRVYKCTEITDPSTGLKVARGYAPSDYTVSGETIWCGQWQSLNYAAQVYLTAMSPDQNTIMGYYSPVGYEQILEYSQNGTDYSWHQDGSFDSTTMMPMLQFMTADTYCDYMAKAILPGQ